MADAVTTTDEAAFLAAICAAPGDDAPRLIYADWLEERAGTVACGRCKGTGSIGAYRGVDPYGIVRREIDCPTCSGTGRVSDGRAERSEFIKVQCELARVQCTGCRPDFPCREGGLCQLEKHPLRRRERDLWRESVGVRIQAEVRPLGIGVWLASEAPAGDCLLVRRGFVAEVRADLATLFGGGTCNHCRGWGSNAIPSDWSDWSQCRSCDGSGRSPGIAAAMWSRQPVTRCVIVDREPAGSHGPWSWYAENDWDGGSPTHHLPGDLFDLIPATCEYIDSDMLIPFKRFDSREAAMSALSAAAVAWGRSLAGLA